LKGKSKQKNQIPFRMNPMSDPMYIEGAEKGDLLAIDINDVKFTTNKKIAALVVNLAGTAHLQR